MCVCARTTYGDNVYGRCLFKFLPFPQDFFFVHDLLFNHVQMML